MLYIPSKALGTGHLTGEELKQDKCQAVHFGDCALGKRAVYLSVFGLSRMGYIPLESVTRVFKRIAMTKGALQENKIYGTLSYLVVQYEGKEKQIRFTHEETVDAMLDAFREQTDIPCGKPKEKKQEEN